MAQKARVRDAERSKLPKFNKKSKMRQYDIFFDSDVGKPRAGFYHSKWYGYTQDASDRVWTVELGYEGRTDLISAKFYNTSRFDWVIEDVNYIKDPIKDVRAGTKLIIPNKSKLYGG